MILNTGKSHGPWRAPAHGVAESDTTDTDVHTHTYMDPPQETDPWYANCPTSRLGKFTQIVTLWSLLKNGSQNFSIWYM